MKTIFCDINFILDIFLKREPFYYSAARVFKKIEEKELKGYLCALSFPTLFYLLSKHLKREKVREILERLRIVFNVAVVNDEVIDLSLTADFNDFEDAIQYYSAIKAKTDCIITRNKRDYLEKKMPIFTPEEFLAIQKDI